MTTKMQAALCGLLFAAAVGHAHAQSAPSSIPVPSVSVPPGTGMPNGKPIDIRGLHSGMTSDAALAVLREHYKTSSIKLVTTSASLPGSNAQFVAFANNGNVAQNDFDYISAAFTSNANGNQVVSILASAKYGRGKERSAAETLAAIKAKYGEPSEITETQFSVLLRYGYRNGQLNKGAACSALTDISRLDTGELGIVQSWQQAMRVSSRINAEARQTGPDTGPCTAGLYITIVYGLYPEQPNKNAVSAIRIAFFDVERYWTAALRDADVVKELREKARSGAPAGSGASKL